MDSTGVPQKETFPSNALSAIRGPQLGQVLPEESPVRGRETSFMRARCPSRLNHAGSNMQGTGSASGERRRLPGSSQHKSAPHARQRIRLLVSYSVLPPSPDKYPPGLGLLSQHPRGAVQRPTRPPRSCSDVSGWRTPGNRFQRCGLFIRMPVTPRVGAENVPEAGTRICRPVTVGSRWDGQSGLVRQQRWEGFPHQGAGVVGRPACCLPAPERFFTGLPAKSCSAQPDLSQDRGLACSDRSRPNAHSREAAGTCPEAGVQHVLDGGQFSTRQKILVDGAIPCWTARFSRLGRLQSASRYRGLHRRCTAPFHSGCGTGWFSRRRTGR